MLINPSQIRVPGPLSTFSAGFADELAYQGYTPNSARFQIWLIAHLSRWLANEGLGVGDLRPAELERFLRARRASGYTQYLSIRALRPLLNYLRSLGITPTAPLRTSDNPVEKVLERYWNYLTIERGLRHTTARGYVHAVRPFLYDRVLPDDVGLTHLTATDVITFVVARCRQQNPGAAKMTVAALRSLLGFLHVDGVIERSLASVVPSVARRRLVGLPKGLEPDQVQSLLASCDGNTRTGRRDIAILTMLVRLGMRAGEVAALELDDIDWRAGEIVVHGKGTCTERLPLPPDVGGVVAAYLQHDRPATAQGRTVFVRIKAPNRALTSKGVARVVADAALRANLGRIGAHRLRHTAATQILRAGGSLREIGQLLRHRCALTTAIYAKADREALRTIARSWPGDVA
jgi:integrase/recombinase XerD